MFNRIGVYHNRGRRKGKAISGILTAILLIILLGGIL